MRIELGSKAARMVVCGGIVVHDPAKDKGDIKKGREILSGTAAVCMGFEKSRKIRISSRL